MQWMVQTKCGIAIVLFAAVMLLGCSSASPRNDRDYHGAETAEILAFAKQHGLVSSIDIAIHVCEDIAREKGRRTRTNFDTEACARDISNSLRDRITYMRIGTASADPSHNKAPTSRICKTPHEQFKNAISRGEEEFGVVCDENKAPYNLHKDDGQFCPRRTINGIQWEDASDCNISIPMDTLAEIHSNVFCKSKGGHPQRYLRLKVYRFRDSLGWQFAWRWRLDGIEYSHGRGRPIGIAFPDRLFHADAHVREHAQRALETMFHQTWKALDTLKPQRVAIWNQCVPYD